VSRFACTLILFCPVLGCAVERWASLFSQGNACYQGGQFDAAERYYRQLLDSGIVAGPVYYNLGNACFKQKKLGEAIYYWEKARQELPRDADVQENLDFANLLVVDRIEPSQDPLAIRMIDAAVHVLTPGQESIVALLLFVAANGFFALYLLSGSPRVVIRSFMASMTLGLLAALLASSAGWKIYEKEHRQQGIITEQKVDIRSGPGPENITVVTVHEGIKVAVRGEANGWYQVGLPNGWNGWLPHDSLRIL
jgi:tetratricopeptide (TPR) repeat protein